MSLGNGDKLADKTSAGTAWDTWNNVKAVTYRSGGGYTGDWTWLNFRGRWGNNKMECLSSIAAIVAGDQCILASGPSSINFRGIMQNGD